MNAYSVIKADYIMKNNAEGRNIFLFLTGNGEEGRYFCRSFFPQDKMDYTKNQASWTLLYKKKVTLSTGEEEILYDRLKKRVTGITASKLYGLDAVFWCVRWAHALTGESPQSARQ